MLLVWKSLVQLQTTFGRYTIKLHKGCINSLLICLLICPTIPHFLTNQNHLIGFSCALRFFTMGYRL